MLAFTKNLVLRANLGYDLAGILVEADTESVLKARSNPQLCSGDNDIEMITLACHQEGLPSICQLSYGMQLANYICC